MNTTQLECFAAVADFLNFSRAAEHLRITQPAVSHQINTLEDELGVKLFYRTSKRVRLTQEGHLFSQYAREMLVLSRMSKDRLQESQRASVLRLGIGCRNFLELNHLKPVLKQMREEFPLLLPVLRLVPAASLENLLEDGDIQVMFTFQETAPKRAVYRELMQRRVVCICGEEHPFAGRSALTIQDLQTGGLFAAYPPHNAPSPLLEAQSRIITGRSPDHICFCDGMETVYTLVETGYAYAVTAEPFNSTPSNVRSIPLDGYAPLSYGVSYRAGTTTPVLRQFLKRMAECLQSLSTAGGTVSAS